MREYKIGDELTGGEALDYLNRRPGENFVMSKIGYSWVYTLHEGVLFLAYSGGVREYKPYTSNIKIWLDLGFTVCIPPSQPEAKVSEYEGDIDSLATSHDFGLIPGVAVKNLFRIIEKHFVRKEP